MAELADAADSKSAGLRPLGVRLPLPAPNKHQLVDPALFLLHSRSYELAKKIAVVRRIVFDAHLVRSVQELNPKRWKNLPGSRSCGNKLGSCYNIPMPRMVKCAKLGRELPGLDEPPFDTELGKKIYENVSAEAWKMWAEHSKMLLNEYRLQPWKPEAQQFLVEQMQQYFFGAGAQLPKEFVPPPE
jgi:Fe-S cluster biosynthesis and repair protein YggX